MISVPARFHGPPRSGNGGYTCGVAARALGASSAADVKLLTPPPLDTELEVEEIDGGIRLVGPDGPVAEARPWDGPGDLEIPPTPSAVDLRRAVDAFDVERYRANHAFPTCFTCGPDRVADDGLHIYGGPVPGAEISAWPWIPSHSVLDDDGRADERVVWAALDCPSGLVWITADPDDVEPAVLGRLAARIDRRPAFGEPTVVVAWRIGEEGRRRMSGSALWSDRGDLLAVAQATWIALTEEQLAAFA